VKYVLGGFGKLNTLAGSSATEKEAMDVWLSRMKNEICK
jgi:hypothetical protein